jgi:hypothetical protein
MLWCTMPGSSAHPNNYADLIPALTARAHRLPRKHTNGPRSLQALLAIDSKQNGKNIKNAEVRNLKVFVGLAPTVT